MGVEKRRAAKRNGEVAFALPNQATGGWILSKAQNGRWGRSAGREKARLIDKPFSPEALTNVRAPHLMISIREMLGVRREAREVSW
jgi:hypothetical protein